jgi:hypothetical protein
MLSLDLFDSKFEKKLHEGAVDDAEYARLKKLGEKIDYLKQARRQTTDADMQKAIDNRIEQYNNERKEILSVRGMKEAEQPQQPPAKGLLKGKDLVTPQQRVAGATPQKPGIGATVKDVVGGVKRWIKGEPDQGPTYEDLDEQDDINKFGPPTGPLTEPTSQGQAVYQQLIQAYKAEVPYVIIPFMADEKQATLTKPSIFNALVALYKMNPNARKKTIEKSFADFESFMLFVSRLKPYVYRKPRPEDKATVAQQTSPSPSPTPTAQTEPSPTPSATATAQTQPEVKKPWSPFGDLSERKDQKKKSKDSTDIQAGDIKVARELQKLRAQYPAARSDVEAVARAEIDSSERNQQQITAIRGANEKQDALLRQLVALDREQGREIDSLDAELARVQATNDQLQKTLSAMNGAKKASTKKEPTSATPTPTPTAAPSFDVAPDDVNAKERIAKLDQEIATLRQQAAAAPDAATQADIEQKLKTLYGEYQGKIEKAQKAAEKKRQQAATAEPLEKELGGKRFKPASIKKLPDFKPVPIKGGSKAKGQIETPPIPVGDPDDLGSMFQGMPLKAASRSRAAMHEHGGGIGPRQHWQSLMREGAMKSAMYDYKIVSDEEFLKNYGMTKRQFYDTIVSPKKPTTKPMFKAPASCQQCGRAHEQCVCESTAKQFGQAVKMAGYSGQSLEADPKEKFDRKIAGYVRAQDQRNLKRVERGYERDDDEDDDWEDVKETFAMPGTTIPRKSLIQGYTVFWNPNTQIVSVTRGGDSEEAAIEQVRVGTPSLKNFRQAADRLIDKIEADDEQIVNENIRDTASATAVIACLLTGGGLSGCATAPQQTSTQQVLKTGQDIGRTVQTAKKITRAGTEAEVRQEIINLSRGMGNLAELNNSNIIRIWKKIKGKPPVPAQPEAPEYGPAEPVRRPQNEAKEPKTKQEYDRAVDSVMNQLRMEKNSAVRQMLNAQLKVLQDFGRPHGWHTDRIIREDTAALAAEDAILKRIFVRHKDLMMEYGADKITQAAESVAYNVGDIAHITDEQITEWVDQVEYILGARP